MSKNHTITHDRSVPIRSALSAFLDAQQTAAALQLWQEKYAHQPTFSVQYFARECCALFGVEAKRNQIVKSLVHELYSQKMSAPDNKPVPLQLGGPQAAAATQVFQLLFRRMIERADPLKARDIIAFVEASLPHMGIDKELQRPLQRWITQSKPVLDINLPQPLMAALVNRTYIGLCEYCGPVKADQYLHAAVTEVAKTRAAAIFHPEELL